MTRYATTIFNPEDPRTPREVAVGRLLDKLAAETGAWPDERLVLESYFDPAAGGWRLTIYALANVPRPGLPETVEETASAPEEPAPTGGVDSLDAMVERAADYRHPEMNADQRPDSYGFTDEDLVPSKTNLVLGGRVIPTAGPMTGLAGGIVPSGLAFGGTLPSRGVEAGSVHVQMSAGSVSGLSAEGAAFVRAVGRDRRRAGY